MATPAARIVLLSRDPVVHGRNGSTTYALALVDLLQGQGAEVTLVVTSAASRSPRLFFRCKAAIPGGMNLRLPGYVRLGDLYLCPLNGKAWARMLSRLATRKPWLRPMRRLLERLYHSELYTGAWDLTPPTAAECELALREVNATAATTVITNYCLWGPLLADGRLGDRRTAILMHDLLSARVQRFRENGLPLDCPPITEAEEMGWLSSADTVLAAQEREAEIVRPRVSARVLVTPVVLRPRALGQERIVPGRCLFVGSNILPNRTGLEFLLHSVWSRVRAEVPEAVLAIAGTVGEALGCAAGGRSFASLGVETLGAVPSLEGEYARAAVCVVPLLVGTGIKIKLLEALSYGKAIVATGVGVQGLEDFASAALSIADDAESFAHAIILLLRNEVYRRGQEAAALRIAEEHFGTHRPLDPHLRAALL